MALIYYINDSHTERLVTCLKSISIGEFVELSAEELMEEDHKDYSVLIWGSGINHHLSYYFEPKGLFYKSVDDAHLDLSTIPKTDRIECNNHLLASFRKKNCLGVEVITHHKGELGTIKTYLEKEIIHTRRPIYRGKRVHKSVDLDVIAGFPAFIMYQERRCKPFSDLIREFEFTLRQNDVVRLDIGGLHVHNSIIGKLGSFFGKQDSNCENVFNKAVETYAGLISMYCSTH